MRRLAADLTDDRPGNSLDGLIGALGNDATVPTDLAERHDDYRGGQLQNLARLAAALDELEARVYTESIPDGLAFDCSAATLARADIWNLVTTAGRVDLIFRPAGVDGYDALRANAMRFRIHGKALFVASLGDILRSREAADRPQDRQDAVVIREMLRVDEARGGR